MKHPLCAVCLIEVVTGIVSASRISCSSGKRRHLPCPTSLTLPNYLLTFYVALVEYHVLRICPVLNILPAPLTSCASPVTSRATQASSRFFKHIILPESLGPCYFLHLEHSPLPLSFKNTFSERPSLTTPYKAGLSHSCSQRHAYFLFNTYQNLK